MLFSSPLFLFVFLPLTLALFWNVPGRRAVLLGCSLFFYGWAEPRFLFVVLVSSLLDWRLGFLVGRSAPALALGVLGNLALLVYAKYTAFAVENLNQLLAWLSVSPWTVPEIALPLGVSFIVFEKITYLVDIRRGIAVPSRSLVDYLNYVFLFPKLLAGPIVKYHDLADQLAGPRSRFEDVRDGWLRFVAGLGKKVIVADSFAPVADEIFGLPLSQLDPAAAWLGLTCFTLQLYFDFSGYSDMAIGLGRMLGFRIPENFNHPYLSTSITDFWRRWHISLGSWIKEYLYIPLGGSRRSSVRGYVNLCICFVLSGFWHGAAWGYVIFGLCHGVALVTDRLFWLRLSARLPVAFLRVSTMLYVMLTFAIFRCQPLSFGFGVLGALAGRPASLPHDVFLRADTLALLVLGVLLVLAPLAPRPNPPTWLRLAGATALLLLCLGRISVNSYQPFIYFRF